MDAIRGMWANRVPPKFNSSHNLSQATQQANEAFGSQPFSSQYSLFSPQPRCTQRGAHERNLPTSRQPSFSSTQVLLSQHTQSSQRVAQLLRTPQRIAESLARAFGPRRPNPEPEVANPPVSLPKSQQSAEESSRDVLKEVLAVKSSVEKAVRDTDAIKKQMSSGLTVAELRVGSTTLPDFLKSSFEKAYQTSHDISVRLLAKFSDVTDSLELLGRRTEQTKQELTDVKPQLKVVTAKLDSLRKSLKRQKKKKRLIPCPNPYSAFGARQLCLWKPKKAGQSGTRGRRSAGQKSTGILGLEVASDAGGSEAEKRRLSVAEASVSKKGKADNEEELEDLSVVYVSVPLATQKPVTRTCIRQQVQLIDRITENPAAVSKDEKKAAPPRKRVEPPGGVNGTTRAKQGSRGKPRKSLVASADSQTVSSNTTATKSAKDVANMNDPGIANSLALRSQPIDIENALFQI